MKSIEARLEALENAQPSIEPTTLYVAFVTPGDSEREPVALSTTVDGGQRWELRDDETPAQLRERASREVPRTALGVGLLFEQYAA